MQSFLQYRRLRKSVKEDLARHQANQPLNSRSTSSLEAESDGDAEKHRDSLPLIAGVRISGPAEHDGAITYLVGWKDEDALEPHNWTSIDGPVADEFNAYYGVGPIAGSLTTGMYLIGLGVGSLFAGPFSETLGRNAIYLGTTVVFILFIMAKALAPNYGAAIVFRFIAAFFGAAPLTCLGGSIGDIWNPLELTYSLPFTTIFSYLAPFVGPVIGAYLPGVGFEWADWISMIIAAAVLVIFALFQPETYGPLLLEWKAHHLRELTGDKRYQVDVHASATSLGRRLLVNIYRPFEMTATEPIILIFSFYLIILYIVLFTFLEGYPFIFTETYGISKSLTFILWAGMLAGDSTALLLIPLLYGWTKKAAAKAEAKGEPLQPEPYISIWSPIVGSFCFGYGVVTVFTTTYLYICFTYTIYAASALTFMTFSRYVISGALLPAAIPMYTTLGPHFALTLLGSIMAFMAPVPFLLYRYGHKVRARSKYVQNKS
ncbi:hypothetical protein Hte_010436 [Hypoxylon texense]